VLLESGMVFASDSYHRRRRPRVEHRKVAVYERPGDQVIDPDLEQPVGDAERDQPARAALAARGRRDQHLTAPSMCDVRDAGRLPARSEAARRPYLPQHSIDASASFILGGQIGGEPQRLFMVYQEGNFIEASSETPFFQVGETKYGKPIIDRVVKPWTSVVDATKCVLISFDSTMRSNVSVGLPIDLVCYQNNALRVQIKRRIGETDPYFTMIHHQWGEGLRRVFAQLPDPYWEDANGS
jgi:putative proteasome-type protease